MNELVILYFAANVVILIAIAFVFVATIWKQQFIKSLIVVALFFLLLTINGTFHSELSGPYKEFIDTIDPNLKQDVRFLEGMPFFRFMFDPNTVGFYSPAGRVIYIDVDKLENDMSFFRITAYHEIGHHIYWTVLTDSERVSYEGIHTYSYLVPTRESGFITDYAMTNAGEDFADSFAYVIMDNDNSTPLSVGQEGKKLWDMRTKIIYIAIERVNAS